MKYCYKCGEPLDDQSKFCSKCGTQFVSTVESVKNNVVVDNNEEEEEGQGGKIALIIILSVTGFLLSLVIIFTAIFLLGGRGNKNSYTPNDYSNYSDGQDSSISEDIPSQTKNDDYILPDSSSRYIDKSELVGLSQWELRIAINEIYARHGRKFGDSALQSYFDSKDWYTGYIEASDFSDAVFNTYEEQNIKTLAAYERELGYRK